MDKVIQFIANYDDWQAVKKIKIEEKTEPITIIEFLASLTAGIDRKVEENLRKIVELEKIDSFLKEEITDTKIEGITKALQAINSRKFSMLLNELTEKIEEKNQKKEIESFIRLYATRKALNTAKISVDYSSIENPQMKKLLKKKLSGNND
jgi:hypothetical protein